MKTIALIDGDIVLYQMAYSSEKSEEEYSFSTNGMASNTDDAQEATKERIRVKIDEFMQSLHDQVGFQCYLAYLSPPRKGSYRDEKSLSQRYKGNRTSEKPVYFDFVRAYLQERWQFVEVERVETDDMLGVQQIYWSNIENTRSIIVTKDKDLKQIPGWNYNWDNQELVEIKREQGHHMLWKQMLTGDSTDNILGCGKKETLVYKTGKKAGEEYEKRVGVGPKEADAILADVNPAQYGTRVLLEYVTRYGHFEGINKYSEAFNLVYILRKPGELEMCDFFPTPHHLVPVDWNENLTKLDDDGDEEF